MTMQNDAAISKTAMVECCLSEKSKKATKVERCLTLTKEMNFWKLPVIQRGQLQHDNDKTICWYSVLVQEHVPQNIKVW